MLPPPGPGTPDGMGGPVWESRVTAAVARDAVRPVMALDTAGLAVAPADLERDLEAVGGLDGLPETAAADQVRVFGSDARELRYDLGNARGGALGCVDGDGEGTRARARG